MNEKSTCATPMLQPKVASTQGTSCPLASWTLPLCRPCELSLWPAIYVVRPQRNPTAMRRACLLTIAVRVWSSLVRYHLPLARPVAGVMHPVRRALESIERDRRPVTSKHTSDDEMAMPIVSEEESLGRYDVPLGQLGAATLRRPARLSIDCEL